MDNISYIHKQESLVYDDLRDLRFTVLEKLQP